MPSSRGRCCGGRATAPREKRCQTPPSAESDTLSGAVAAVPAAARGGRAGRRGGGRLLYDLRARGAHRVPRAAEVDEALALHLAGVRVAAEEVERVARVDDLELPVLALRRREEGLLQSCPGD